MGIALLATQEYHLRRSCFKQVFNHIDATFPFENEKVRKIVKKTYQRFAEYLSSVENDHDFFTNLECFIASLGNAHTKLTSYPTKQFFAPVDYRVEFLDGTFFLFHQSRCIGRIISIDGRPVDVIFSYWAKHIASSSKQYTIARAKNFLLLDQKGKQITVRVQTQHGKRETYLLVRRLIRDKEITIRDIVSKRVIQKNLGYLKIASWNNRFSKEIRQFCDKTLDEFTHKKLRGLIIDVRGNAGGDSRIACHVAGRFFRKKVLFGITKTRILKSKLQYQINKLCVTPREPFVPLSILILIDPYCLSSNEYFIAGMKDNKRALLIGQTTGGSSGNPKTFEIPYKNAKLKIQVATWRYYRKDGIPLEKRGIQPDIVVKPNLDDLKRRRDVVLKRAIQEAMKF